MPSMSYSRESRLGSQEAMCPMTSSIEPKRKVCGLVRRPAFLIASRQSECRSGILTPS